MDCSGFVKTVYFSGGIILSRDASQQFLHGLEVDISSSIDSLKSGDLVFFGSLNRKGEKRITHVGIYIGDSEVIHSSGMVRINSLDPGRSNYSEYLGKRIMGARRIIGTGSEKGVEMVADNDWYRTQK
jgi:cell wall-associated NlpC family hydrolase